MIKESQMHMFKMINLYMMFVNLACSQSYWLDAFFLLETPMLAKCKKCNSLCKYSEDFIQRSVRFLKRKMQWCIQGQQNAMEWNRMQVSSYVEYLLTWHSFKKGMFMAKHVWGKWWAVYHMFFFVYVWGWKDFVMFFGKNYVKWWL